MFASGTHTLACAFRGSAIAICKHHQGKALGFVRVIFSLLFLLGLSSSALAQSIVIDPGHGGSDPGGTGTGLEEKEIVLDVGLRFRDLLEADTADESGGGSWQVSMTRDTDVFISLAGRSAFANEGNADRFMSIHANAFGNPAANGTETFSFNEGTISATLRELVQEEMIAAWGLTNRGNKTGNFAVLRETDMPAELHELAFVTNATDAEKLASDADRQLAAEAHLRAIQRHYDHEPYIPTDMPPPGPDEYGSIRLRVLAEGQGIGGVELRLDGEAVAESNAEGIAEISQVSVGTHRIGASLEGYVSVEIEVEVRANEVVQSEVVLELDGGGVCDPDEEECSREIESGCGCQQSSPWSTQLGALLVLLALLWMRQRQES